MLVLAQSWGQRHLNVLLQLARLLLPELRVQLQPLQAKIQQQTKVVSSLLCSSVTDQRPRGQEIACLPSLMSSGMQVAASIARASRSPSFSSLSRCSSS